MLIDIKNINDTLTYEWRDGNTACITLSAILPTKVKHDNDMY